MTTNILGFEDPFFTWILTYTPTLGVCMIIFIVAVWLTTKVSQYNGRLIKVEHDTAELKTDMKVVKKRLTRIESKVSRLESKLDLLISHLITKKQVDKDALG